MQLNLFDYSVLALYFILVFWVSFKPIKSQDKTSEEYFLGGRDLTWFFVGASLFASNIGSEHLIGLAGTGASSGVAVAQFELLACFIVLILGWVFVPFYLRSGVHTMPEFLEQRYNSKARTYLSFISVIAYVITKISVTIFAGAIIFESLNVSFYTGAIIVVVVTGVYTVFGGLKAVVYTDAVQTVIMLFGSVIVTLLGLQHLGGFSELTNAVPETYFSFWRVATDPDFPWTGILFGAPILGVWYWCTDQFIVQRVLSAKNIHHARRGAIFGGYLKLTPLFLFVMPGIVCFALAQKGMLTLERPDSALPTLIGHVLPSGLKGLVLAGLLAALMSSLSGVFNSCSTLITYDFYKRWKPDASDKKLVIIGQVSTFVLVILGILWIPLMKHISGEIFKYVQSVQAYISPPIAAIFLFGIFFRRINSAGALASLGAGFVLGILRLILEIKKADLSGFWLDYASINFLHFALCLFVVCSIVLFVVSYATAAPDQKRIANITYDWNQKWNLVREAKIDIVWSVLLVVSVIILWVLFS
ncbi:MAG: sodium:solute symporter [Bacteriovoracaceae bacterium]|nr:sodium:solute symporter [Bacteriovoracaceae bacterium]